jgi:hypothetical protein
VLHVIPMGAGVKVADATSVDGWYRIEHDGEFGGSSGKYLEAASGDGGGTTSARTEAIARAQSAVGFSYWWGHGRFRPEGSSSANRGTCFGSCPSCTHTGNYGGDCSGLVAKVWQTPGSNTDPATDSHPYSTADFVSDTSQWSTIPRDSVQRGDARVYRSGGAGHIFVYRSGDSCGHLTPSRLSRSIHRRARARARARAGSGEGTPASAATARRHQGGPPCSGAGHWASGERPATQMRSRLNTIPADVATSPSSPAHTRQKYG